MITIRASSLDRVLSCPGSLTVNAIVKPREGVRLLELYESQMLNKTYLNIEPKNGRKKRGA